MPPCHCDYAKCSGALVSKQTLANHQREDHVKHAQDALLASEDACKELDHAIAIHLSQLSLSLNPFSQSETEVTAVNLEQEHLHDASQNRSHRSGCNVTETETMLPRHVRPIRQGHPHHTNPSYREQVEVFLCRLAEIETVVEELVVSVESQLPEVGRPRHREDEFPLTPALNAVMSVKDDLAHIQGRSPAVEVAKNALSAQVSDLLRELQQAKKSWCEQRKSIPLTDQPSVGILDTDSHNASILEGADPIIQLAVFTMVVLQVMLHTSRRGCHFLLSMLQYIVQLSLLRKSPIISIHDQKLLADFPKDPDSATRQLKLDSKDTIYAVCPKAKCQKLHAPKFVDSSPIPQYLKYCNHSELGGKHCGTRLTRPRHFGRHEVDVPIKRFVSFSFKDFVASLTSRPGFEEKMDASWRTGLTVPTAVEDVFDGKFLRTFKGPDGELFGTSELNGRYVFSLSVDFFNPYSNKQAGKKVSVGVISVVCLNLPISLRYMPENMFLAGIIPGPKEPRLTIINNYLAPMITEFLEFWDPGVQFSKTYQYPQGRLILCALVLVVCDLVATRKVIASGQHNHEHFCNLCYCTRSEHGYRNTDYHNWERRTHVEWLKSAEEWLACKTQLDRDTKFSLTGLRWSELLRLPYFDMVRCVVVDPMHNLFLGLLKEHFTGLLGIDLPKEKKSAVLEIKFGLLPSNMNKKDKDGVEKLKSWLELPFTSVFSPIQEKAISKLMRVNLPALEFACKELRVPLPAFAETEHPNRKKYTKNEYAKSLLVWRRLQSENSEAGADTSTRHGHVLHSDDMAGIWSDIEQLLTPTWMTSIPSNLGSPSHGKLKADQWRAAGTVHLPLSLIRLWAVAIDDQPRSVRCRQILEVTMSLVSAVIVATSHTITSENAEAYLTYMLDYLNGVKRLFPEYRFRPNHHMALHIYDFLLSFGPVHSWWAFPFERMIGMIQRMPNNGKIGELEETIARAYTRSANLRTLPFKAGCPEVIRNARFILERLSAPQIRSSLLTDIHMFSGHLEEDLPSQQSRHVQASALSPELCSAFTRAGIGAAHRGQSLSHLSINGLSYSTSSKHAGNSCALVMFPGSQQVVPCQIVYIIQFQAGNNTQIYLGVRRHRSAQISRDPYLRYAALRAKIWDSRLDDLEIVKASDIKAHFACLPVSMEGQHLVAVMSLSRIIIVD